MSISINSKLNIAFTGMQEDIQVSRQIVKNFRKKLGKPHSNTYVDTKITQNLRKLRKNSKLLGRNIINK